MSQLRVLILTLSLLLNGNQISCFTQPQHHRHVNKAFGTTTANTDTSARPSVSTNTSPSSTTSLYSYNPYKSKNGRYSDETELNRAKFLLNQAKGSLKESEMRATAAERRVALLAKEIKEMNSTAPYGEGEGDDESG